MKRMEHWLWVGLGSLILTALVMHGQMHGTASAAVSNGKYQVLNEQFEELKHMSSPSNAQPSTQPPK